MDASQPPTSPEPAPKPPLDRKMPRPLVAALFLALVAMPFLWRALHTPAGNPAVTQAFATLGGEPIDRPLEDVELDTPLELGGGKTTTLREQLASGDVVVLHFWASWCPPCVHELPEIHQLAVAMQPRKLRVVSVSHDDDWADANAAVAKASGKPQPTAGVWLREVQGQSGDEKKMLRVRMGTDKLPETYIIQNNHILARLIASQNWQDPRMLAALESLAPLR